MIEAMYNTTEVGTEVPAVMDFLARFCLDDETESEFLAAVHDARLAALRDGVRVSLQLFSEVKA